MTTAEIIEGEVVEVESRALTVVEPASGLARAASSPEDLIELATRMATALARIVEKQKLYAVIQGKKYPQVEAWSTIGRMDNVVAREEGNPVRHDDGSYEAAVQLVRLSDGAVIGRASAICGTPDDQPWAKRPEPSRRSMAVTRATSRAFRQQYSWIMALAGYEPTPADEMPQHEPEPPVAQRYEPPPGRQRLSGTVSVGKSAPVDLQLRPGPPEQGSTLGFALTGPAGRVQVVATGQLAEKLALRGLAATTQVTVEGDVESVAWEKDGKKMPPYRRMHLERIETEAWLLP